jgi:N-methylhydantoinase A
VEAAVRHFEDLKPGAVLKGPAIVESSFTTVVINPGAAATATETGSLSIQPNAG